MHDDVTSPNAELVAEDTSAIAAQTQTTDNP